MFSKISDTLANLRLKLSVAKSYKDTFSTTAGKLVLADLAKVCNAYSSSFNKNSETHTAFNEGTRWVFLRIIGHLEMDHDKIMATIKDQEVKQHIEVE